MDYATNNDAITCMLDVANIGCCRCSHGECLETHSLTATPGEHPYEWTLNVGGLMGKPFMTSCTFHHLFTMKFLREQWCCNAKHTHRKAFINMHVHLRSDVTLSAYARILDASDYGDDHVVMYECDLQLDDGSCDPHYEHIGILTRHREDMSEDVRAHLRQVLRDACFEPGDFIGADHTSE